MKKTLLMALLGLSVMPIIPPCALAAGGPVGPVQGSYIGVTGSPYRYAAFDARGNTVIKRRAGAGSGVAELRVSGQYGIPGVDYSGAMTGLSANGRTLVLAHFFGGGSARTTRLLVLDTRPLAVRTRLVLPGFSAVDAISPDGRWLYLIHYASSDITKYEVLAYDLPARRLLAKPVVDPRDRGEAMTGVPVNRVMSAEGRWAYTLYLRPSDVPFVHALDTTERRAVCIDLPRLSNADIGNARLSLTPGGSTLKVNAGGVTRAVIDTRTFAVSASAGHSTVAPGRPVAHRPRLTRDQGDGPWQLIVLSIAALGVLAAIGAGVARSRRHLDYRRGTDQHPFIDVENQQTDRTPADHEVAFASGSSGRMSPS